MKPVFSIIFLFAFSLFAVAQSTTTPSVDPNAPVIKFDLETHDFGQLTPGEDATIEFKFTNTGKTDLILSDVKASCGCTTPFWSKEPVGPGETGTITAKYNTVGKSGAFNKAITVYSNSTEPDKKIFIKGNVIGESENGMPEKKPSIVNTK